MDGTEEQVLCNYVHCQLAYLNWNIKHATHKEEILTHSGNVFKVFTTPSASTFYYALKYRGRYLVFVIEARNGWLHGYYGVNGMYEFESVQVEPYMNDERCRRLPFDGNHHVISKGGIGKTRIGLCALRDAFDAIYGYTGDPKAEHPNFRKSFGVIVVHICESMKLKPVYKRVCEAFTDPSVDKLGIQGSVFIERLITSWSYLSGLVMRAIDNTKYQICNARDVPHISSSEDIVTHLSVLCLDGYFLGKFEHGKATNPRQWEPLERGNGVPSFDDIVLEF